jgi:CO/xanthine dehydrogenase FAD-binding subunit
LKCNGNICIASGGKKACFSEFVSDTAPALIAMNAHVRLIELEGECIIPLEELFSGDGVKPKTIKNTTIVKEIILPLGKNFRCVFKKLRLRETLEFTSLTSVVSINIDNVIRIVLAGVDPKPVLVDAQLNDDKSELIKKAVKAGRAVENDMFSRTYRRDMIPVFLNESFEKLGFVQ